MPNTNACKHRAFSVKFTHIRVQSWVSELMSFICSVIGQSVLQKKIRVNLSILILVNEITKEAFYTNIN